MADYRRVYESQHLQADCQEPGSASEPYIRQSSTGYLHLSTYLHIFIISRSGRQIALSESKRLNKEQHVVL